MVATLASLVAILAGAGIASAEQYPADTTTSDGGGATGGSEASKPPPVSAEAGEVVAPPAPTAGPARSPTGLVTNVFFETDLRQALSDVGAQVGVTIVTASEVRGYATADLREASLEQALRTLLASGGYVFKKMPEGYYLVGSTDPTSPTFRLLAETTIIPLQYVRGKDLLRLLPQHMQDYVKTDEQGTRVTICAPAELLADIETQITRLDAPPPQVMIEALVVETTAETAKEIGLDWASSFLSLEGQTGTLKWTRAPRSAMVTLKALVDEGRAHVRANPSVAALEGQPAEVEVGKEQWFAITTGPVTFPYTTLEQIPVGITLRITPWVAEKAGEITVEIAPEVKDVVGQGATGLPEITVRRAKTTVRVADGETIAVGGLLSTSRTRHVSKVPILGDIPLLGQLFRRVHESTLDTEVLIFITPHILVPGAASSPAAQTGL
jgi:type IV pilus assembly protein PilQ